MIFLSNVVVDSRPCGGSIPGIAYSIRTSGVSEERDEDGGIALGSGVAVPSEFLYIEQ